MPIRSNKIEWKSGQWVQDHRVWVANAHARIRIGQLWQNVPRHLREQAERNPTWGAFWIRGFAVQQGTIVAVVDRSNFLSSSGKPLSGWPTFIKVDRLKPPNYRLLKEAA